MFFHFLWSFRKKFNMFKDLFLKFKNIQTQNCAPIQCRLWIVMLRLNQDNKSVCQCNVGDTLLHRSWCDKFFYITEVQFQFFGDFFAGKDLLTCHFFLIPSTSQFLASSFLAACLKITFWITFYLKKNIFAANMLRAINLICRFAVLFHVFCSFVRKEVFSKKFSPCQVNNSWNFLVNRTIPPPPLSI